MKRVLVAVPLAVMLALGWLGEPARAAGPTTVYFFGSCTAPGGITVPAGPVVFQWRWIVAHRGEVYAYLHDTTVTGTLTTTTAGGETTTTAISNGDSYFSAPRPYVLTSTSQWPYPYPWDKHYGALPLDTWATFWTYPVTLSAGEQVTLSLNDFIAHPTVDGFLPVYQPGSVFGSTISCTITGN